MTNLKVITLPDDMHGKCCRDKTRHFSLTAQVDFEQEPVISFKKKLYINKSIKYQINSAN